MEHYCNDQFSRQFDFHQNFPADLDFDNVPDPETMLRCHHVLTRNRIGSKVLLPGRCNLLERNTTRAFREWWSKTFISSTCNPHVSDFTKKQSDLFDTNISKDEDKLGSKPKLRIVPLRAFCSSNGGWFFSCQDFEIDVAIPAMPVPVIPIQSITPLPHVTNDIKEYFKISPVEM
ncbi:hypothetical protein Cgig2_005762 [Carnegiea gigantea]|uniref:Uncharacterized protein n=1 Tax=Carnegiea gigantea TaxID=171969 RepID=A0A9Q1GVD2_9CARY|nr:hypothetical protein Cgig2_005762 [Carnegiea gigantea]